ncbi:MAG: caspase family protein [Prosthecobacter sp.]
MNRLSFGRKCFDHHLLAAAALLVVGGARLVAAADYVTTLGPQDRVSSAGVRLTSIAEILRQDRANVNSLHRADPGDEQDPAFRTKEARVRFESAQVTISQDLQKAILEGLSARVRVRSSEGADGGLRLFVDAVAQEPVGGMQAGGGFKLRYSTSLGAADFKNSNGERLQNWGEVLAQDRANVNSLGRADPGDQTDAFFRTPVQRAQLQSAAVQVAPDVIAAIQAGQAPRVEVSVLAGGMVQVAGSSSSSRPPVAVEPAPPPSPTRGPYMSRDDFDQKLPQVATLLGRLPAAEAAPCRQETVPVFQAFDDGETQLVTISDDGSVAATVEHQELRVWDIRSRLAVYHTQTDRFGITGTVVACWASNSGRYVVVMTGQDQASSPPPSGSACWLVDLDMETVIRQWSGQSAHVVPVFAPDEKWVAAQDQNGLFACQTGKAGVVLRGPSETLLQPWICPDGRWFAVSPEKVPENLVSPHSSDDGKVRSEGHQIEDLVTHSKWRPQAQHNLRHELKLDSLGWAPGGELLVRHRAGDVLLDLNTLRTHVPAAGHLQAMAADGMLFSRIDPPDFPSPQVTWLSKQGKSRELLSTRGAWKVYDHKLSPDGRFVWMNLRNQSQLGLDGIWKVLATATGQVVAQQTPPSDANGDLESSELYAWQVFFVGADHLVVDKTLLDLRTGAKTGMLPGDCIAVPPGQKSIVCVSTVTGHTEVIDVSGRVTARSARPIPEPRSLLEMAVTPDMRSALVLGSGPGYLVNLERGNILFELGRLGRQRPFFSDDGQTLFVPHHAGGSWCVDSSTGQVRERLQGIVSPISYRYGRTVLGPAPGIHHPRYLVHDASRHQAEIWSAERKVLATLNSPHFESSPRQVNATLDGRRMLVQTSWAGGHQLWDLTTGEKLCDAVGIQTGDWLLMLPDGHYAASPGAIKAIAIRRQGRVFPLDQFDLSLNRPDLVLARLGGEPARVAFLRRIVEARQKMAGIDAASVEEPPAGQAVRIVAQTTSPGNGSVKITCRVEHPQDGQFLVTTQNGVPRHRLPLSKAASAASTHELDLDLLSGSNRIGLEIQSGKGWRSPRVISEVPGPEKDDLPVVHAVIIGVSDYPGESHDLPGVTADGAALKQTLEAWSGTEQRVSVQLLRDAGATPDKIVGAIQSAAAAARTQDLLLVYLAGHGVSTPETGFQLLCGGFDLAAGKGPTAGMSSLVGAMARTRALRRVMLVDACAVGNRSTAETGQEIEDMFSAPFSQDGVAILGAARWNEQAGESDEAGHGYFTLALLEVLNSDPLKAPRREMGVVRLSDLVAHAADTVGTLSKGTQTPSVVALNPDVDVPLVGSRQLAVFEKTLSMVWYGNPLEYKVGDPAVVEQSHDMSCLSADQLQMLCFSVYARHGRSFQDPAVKAFLQRLGGDYGPDPDYDDRHLTNDDRTNLEVLTRLRRVARAR